MSPVFASTQSRNINTIQNLYCHQEPLARARQNKSLLLVYCDETKELEIFLSWQSQIHILSNYRTIGIQHVVSIQPPVSFRIGSFREPTCVHSQKWNRRLLPRRLVAKCKTSHGSFCVFLHFQCKHNNNHHYFKITAAAKSSSGRENSFIELRITMTTTMMMTM